MTSFEITFPLTFFLKLKPISLLFFWKNEIAILKECKSGASLPSLQVPLLLMIADLLAEFNAD